MKISCYLITLALVLPAALLSMSCHAVVKSDPASPATGPLPGKIAFFSNRTGSYHLYSINPDGTEQTQLTHDESRFELDGYPSWSPDGSKIVYNSFASGPDGGRQKIYVINADGSSETCLTKNSDGHAPSWSPDGNKILFVSDRDSDPNKNIFISELYLMESDGSQQTRLTYFNGKFYAANWSPDGSKIGSVFQPGYGGPEKILLMKSDVTVADKIYSDDRLLCRALFFSPDGGQILLNFSGPMLAISGMYLMNTDGSNLKRLGGGEGSWSPDGRKIVFSYGSRTAPFSSQLWLMNKDRSNLVKLLDCSGTSARPAWSR